MGTDIPKDEDNPPVFTLPKLDYTEFRGPNSHDGVADCGGLLHSGNTAGGDPMSFSFPHMNINGAYMSRTQNIPQSCDIEMADFMRLNSQQAPQIDLNFQSMGSNTYRNLSPSQIPIPEQMVGGVYRSTSNDSNMGATNFLNDGNSAFGFHNPQASLLQNYRNLAGLGGSKPLLHHTQNNREAEDNAKVSEGQFCHQQMTDGNFLSLGLGGNIEARHKPKPFFSSQEISSILGEVDSPKLSTTHVRHDATRSSRTHNLGVGFSSIPNSADGLLFPTHSVGGSTSANDVGVIRGGSTGFSSSPSCFIRMPQVGMQQNFCNLGTRSSSYLSMGDARDGGFRGDHPSLSGAHSGLSPTAFLSSRQDRLPGLASGPDTGTWITTGTTSDQQLQNMGSTENLSLESLANSHFLQIGGNSSMRDHSGPAISGLDGSATQAAGSNQFIRRISGQPAGQLFSGLDDSVAPVGEGNLIPNTIGIQSNSNSSAGGVYPNRLGFQILQGAAAAQAAAASPFPKGMGVQAASEFWQPQQNGGLVHYRRVPPEGMPVHLPTDLRGPSSIATGQAQSNVPVPYLRPVSTTTGQQGIQVARGDEVGQQVRVLKRGATQPPPAAAPLVQRRKMTTPHPPPLFGPSIPYHQPQSARARAPAPAYYPPPLATLPPSPAYYARPPAIQPPPCAAPAYYAPPFAIQRSSPPASPAYVPVSTQAPSPAPVPIRARPLAYAPAYSSIPLRAPAPPAHIKWQGFDGPPESTGDKCLICKRDLSFSPEGPIQQPPVRPSVAVLPCGHTFHDHCLQEITPEEQSKDPPCIPCAMGGDK